MSIFTVSVGGWLRGIKSLAELEGWLPPMVYLTYWYLRVDVIGAGSQVVVGEIRYPHVLLP